MPLRKCKSCTCIGITAMVTIISQGPTSGVDLDVLALITFFSLLFLLQNLYRLTSEHQTPPKVNLLDPQQDNQDHPRHTNSSFNCGPGVCNGPNPAVSTEPLLTT